MHWIFAFFLIPYACLTLAFWWEWRKAQKGRFNVQKDVGKISVLIPIRNEEKNIGYLLQDLEAQTLPINAFEILILDDASTDTSAAIVRQFQQSSRMAIRLISLPTVSFNTSPKKRAITHGVALAQHPLILTTDGDCRVPPTWLATVQAAFAASPQTQLLAGPVSFIEEKSESWLKNWWNSAQIIEFGSLIGAAAATLRWGVPTMCSGANLAYRKTAFEAVNGFEGNEALASGDDEFLMHKIAEAFPQKLGYLVDKQALVFTYPHGGWGSFYRQRKRWASKWRHYKSWQPAAVAVFTFGVNLLTIWALLQGYWVWLAVKFLPEVLYLTGLTVFLGKPKNLKTLPLLLLLYPFYVVYIGLAVQGKATYQWKGRALK